MDIRFDIDTEKLTVADMLLIEDIQDGKRPFHGMTDLMARNMVGEDGAPLAYDEARAILGALNLTQFTEVVKEFAGAIQRKAVPPKMGGI